MMQQTTLYSYAMIISEPVELGRKQKQVYNAIKVLGTTTDRQLSKFLNWSINTVTPRRGELAKLGIIEKCGTTWDEVTNRPVIKWGALR